MPEKRFALEAGGPERLTVSWSGLWSNFQVQLDGRLLGGIEGGTGALKAGREFPLGDGTTLKVQLVTGVSTELQLLRDGIPIPGSSSDPAMRLKVAGGIIYFIAALSGGLGLCATLFRVQFLLEMGIGGGAVAAGAIYGVLGYLVREQRSKLALGAAMALFGIDGILMLAQSSGHYSGIVMRGLFLMQMYKGFDAISALEEPVLVPVRVPSASGPTPKAVKSAVPGVCALCGLPLKPEEAAQAAGKNLCRSCAGSFGSAG